MTDIFDEIREEAKYIKLTAVINKYLPYVIVAAIVLITVTSLKMWWTTYQHNKIYSDGGVYMFALNKIRIKNLEEAIKKLEEIQRNHSNYAALANFNLAAYSFFQKDIDGTIGFLDQIENNSNYADIFREYAKMQNILSQLDNNKIDTAQAIEFFEQYIKSDSIFASSTKEFLTSLYIKQGNFQKANELINTILTDPKAPPSVRSRVEQVSALIKNNK